MPSDNARIDNDFKNDSIDSAEKRVVDKEMSIADMILETVSSHFWENNLPGFTFCNEYQMFYNPESGYYYDQNSSLFYHPSTRCYYFYDEKTSNFFFHSRVPAEHHWDSEKAKKHAISLHGHSYVGGMDQEEVDIFEFLDDVVSLLCQREVVSTASSGTAESYNDTEISSEDEINQLIEEERIKYPPCIRLVGANGNLYIITIDGAKIGFDIHSDISLDISTDAFAKISQNVVAEVDYDKAEDEFRIKSLSDEIPVYLNDCVLLKNVIGILKHNGKCAIADNLFHIHIHHGSNTCNGCEPGLIATRKGPASHVCSGKALSSEELRRKNLKALKAEYGLLGEEYEKKNRLKQRKPCSSGELRKCFSQSLSKPSLESDESIYSNCAAKPILGKKAEVASHIGETKINESNKGYKLLRSLGWSEGMGLGKNCSGIKEPIVGKIKYDKAGLGLSSPQNITEPKSEKIRILEITQRRFDSICNDEL